MAGRDEEGRKRLRITVRVRGTVYHLTYDSYEQQLGTFSLFVCLTTTHRGCLFICTSIIFSLTYLLTAHAWPNAVSIHCTILDERKRRIR